MISYLFLTSSADRRLQQFGHALFSLLTLFWITLLAGMILHVCPARALAKPAATMPAEGGNAYQDARNRIQELIRTDAGKKRENWLSAVRAFRRLYHRDPGSALSPRVLFTMAQSYAKMYRRFHLRIDLDEAIYFYQQLAGQFPNSNLADDALFHAARLLEDEYKDGVRAAELYTRIIKRHAKGDFSSRAHKELLRLTREKKISLQEPAHLPDTLPPAVVAPVKFWSSNDYTRIALQVSRPISYTSKLLEKDGDRPRRLYLDLNGCQIAPQHRQPLPIEDGLLKRVRAKQLNNDTVRVILDIESISNYNIFNLKDPFRIVIDVHGNNRKQLQTVTKGEESTRGAPKKEPKINASLAVQPEKLPDRISRRIVTITPHARKHSMSQAAADAVIVLKDNKKWRPQPGQQVRKTRVVKNTRESQSFSLAQQLGLGIRKIILDPGHGGKDPGAMAHGMKEKDIVLTVAKHLRDILREQYGYEVVMTRTKDVFLPLEERTALANTSKADLFVSIHVNAHPDKKVRGIETFYLNLATNSEAMRVAALENATSTHNINELQDILTDLMQNSRIIESSHLARYVQNNLISGLKRNRYPVRSHGVKQAPFYVLIGAQMPAILAEISFLTNPGDARLLGRKQYLYDIAEQMAAGLHSYANKQLAAGQRLQQQ